MWALEDIGNVIHQLSVITLALWELIAGGEPCVMNRGVCREEAHRQLSPIDHSHVQSYGRNYRDVIKL